MWLYFSSSVSWMGRKLRELLSVLGGRALENCNIVRAVIVIHQRQGGEEFFCSFDRVERRRFGWRKGFVLVNANASICITKQ